MHRELRARRRQRRRRHPHRHVHRLLVRQTRPRRVRHHNLEAVRSRRLARRRAILVRPRHIVRDPDLRTARQRHPALGIRTAHQAVAQLRHVPVIARPQLTRRQTARLHRHNAHEQIRDLRDRHVPVRKTQRLDPLKNIRPVRTRHRHNAVAPAHRIGRPIAREHRNIAAQSAVQAVVPGTALEHIVARVPVDHIVQGTADKRVVPGSTAQRLRRNVEVIELRIKTVVRRRRQCHVRPGHKHTPVVRHRHVRRLRAVRRHTLRHLERSADRIPRRIVTAPIDHDPRSVRRPRMPRRQEPAVRQRRHRRDVRGHLRDDLARRPVDPEVRTDLIAGTVVALAVDPPAPALDRKPRHHEAAIRQHRDIPMLLRARRAVRVHQELRAHGRARRIEQPAVDAEAVAVLATARLPHRHEAAVRKTRDLTGLLTRRHRLVQTDLGPLRHPGRRDEPAIHPVTAAVLAVGFPRQEETTVRQFRQRPPVLGIGRMGVHRHRRPRRLTVRAIHPKMNVVARRRVIARPAHGKAAVRQRLHRRQLLAARHHRVHQEHTAVLHPRRVVTLAEDPLTAAVRAIVVGLPDHHIAAVRQERAVARELPERSLVVHRELRPRRRQRRRRHPNRHVHRRAYRKVHLGRVRHLDLEAVGPRRLAHRRAILVSACRRVGDSDLRATGERHPALGIRIADNGELRIGERCILIKLCHPRRRLPGLQGDIADIQIQDFGRLDLRIGELQQLDIGQHVAAVVAVGEIVVGHRHHGALPAHRVVVALARERGNVVAATAIDCVVVAPAFQQVMTTAAFDRIRGFIADQGVVPVAAPKILESDGLIETCLAQQAMPLTQPSPDPRRRPLERQHVAAGTAVERIGATADHDGIVTVAAHDVVVACAADKLVVTGGPIQRVVTCAAEQAVGLQAAGQAVGPVTAVDDVLAVAAIHTVIAGAGIDQIGCSGARQALSRIVREHQPRAGEIEDLASVGLQGFNLAVGLGPVEQQDAVAQGLRTLFNPVEIAQPDLPVVERTVAIVIGHGDEEIVPAHSLSEKDGVTAILQLSLCNYRKLNSLRNDVVVLILDYLCMGLRNIAIADPFDVPHFLLDDLAMSGFV